MTDFNIDSTSAPRLPAISGIGRASNGSNAGIPARSTGSALDTANFGTTALSPEQRAALTEQFFGVQRAEAERERVRKEGLGIIGSTLAFTAAVPLDFIDTVASSVSNVTGIVGLDFADRGDLLKFAGATPVVGTKLLDYYDANQGLVSATSGVAGAILTGYLASAKLLPLLGNSLAASSAVSGSRLWQSGALLNASVRAGVVARSLELAKKGEMLGGILSPQGARLAGLQIARTTGMLAAEEAAILTIMHTNDLIWDPEDMASNAFWSIVIPSALGIGLGTLQARKALRGVANSPLIVTTRAAAQDRPGVARAVESLLPGSAIGVTTLSRSNLPRERLPGASATSHALGTHQAVPTGIGEPASLTDANRAIQREALAHDLDVMKFKGGQVKYWADEVLGNDPLSLHAIERIWPTNGAEAVKKLETDVAELRIAAAAKNSTSATAIDLFKRADAIDEQIGRVAVNVNGTWYSRAEAERIIAAAKAKSTIVRSPNMGHDVVNVTLSDGNRTQLSFSGLSMKPKDFAKLSSADKLAIVDGFRTLSDSLIKNGAPFQVLSPGKAKWLEYDAAIWHAARGGQVRLPAGVATLQDLEALSLKMKALELSRSKAAGPGGGGVLNEAEEFLFMNLPTPTYMERIGADLGETTRVLLDAAAQGATATDLRQMRIDLQRIAGYSQDLGEKSQRLSGDLFDVRASLDDPAKAPVYAVIDKSGFSQQGRILEAVADRLVEDRLAAISALTAPNPKQKVPGFVSELTDAMLLNPDYRIASQLTGIADDSITGSGASGVIGQALGETRTAEFRFRDNPVMLSLQRLVEQANRRSDNYLIDLLNRHMANATERLSGPGSRVSRQLLNVFHTYARGWDLGVASSIGVVNGRALFGITLEATEQNAKRLGITVRDMERAAKAGSPHLLQNPRTKQTLTVDTDSLDWQQRFNALSKELLIETNKVRVANGIQPLKNRAWYVPPPPTEGKLVGFTFDANNQLMPNRGIIAETQADFNRQKALIEKELGGTVRVRTREQASYYLDTFDEAAADWFDPTSITAQNRQQTGGLGTELIQQNSIQDTLNWVQTRVEGLGRGTLRVLLNEQIHSARMRHEVASVLSGSLNGRRTIYQEYEAIARGIPLSSLETSISGRTVRELTAVGQSLIGAVWPTLEHFTPRAAIRYAQDVAQRLGVPEDKAAKVFGKGRTYKSIATELGPHSPYRDFADFLEQNHQVSPPPQIRAITQKLNTFSGALILRYADIHQAGMNLIGLITTLPAIVRAGRAPVTTFGSGRGVSILDTTRILTGALADMVSPRSAKTWEIMRRNGDTTQQILDFNQTLALVNDRGSFARVMLGKGSAGSSKGRLNRKFEERGIDGLISIATDSTENFSRAYSHFVGLRVAALAGHVDPASAHQFAREIANAGIANYSIVNRPEAFQSAFGSLLGLFTSWSRNYNQRLFRWLEEGQYARFGEQYAIQTALFGVNSVAGFDALSSLFEKTAGVRDEQGLEVPTLNDRIYSRLGPEAGSAIAHGGIAELTGLALWTRGDTNIRAPSLNPLEAAPALGLLSKVGKVLRDVSVSGADSELLSESLSRNLPNRMLRGLWTELVESGVETDVSGRIVSESQTLVDSFSRMTGIRSARQQAEVEAYYANSAAIRNDAVRLTPLRVKTRSLIRKGQLTPEAFQAAFDNYLKAGGNPANFNNWIQSQIREVSASRSVLQLRKALDSPNNRLRVLRFDNLTTGF